MVVEPNLQSVVRAHRLALILVGALLEEAGAGSLDSFSHELAALAQSTAETMPEEGLVLAAWAAMALESATLMQPDPARSDDPDRGAAPPEPPRRH